MVSTWQWQRSLTVCKAFCHVAVHESKKRHVYPKCRHKKHRTTKSPARHPTRHGMAWHGMARAPRCCRPSCSRQCCHASSMPSPGRAPTLCCMPCCSVVQGRVSGLHVLTTFGIAYTFCLACTFAGCSLDSPEVSGSLWRPLADLVFL